MAGVMFNVNVENKTCPKYYTCSFGFPIRLTVSHFSSAIRLLILQRYFGCIDLPSRYVLIS